MHPSKNRKSLIIIFWIFLFMSVQTKHSFIPIGVYQDDKFSLIYINIGKNALLVFIF